MAALIRQPCGLAVLKRWTAHSVFLFFSIIKDSQGARAGMGSYAGADIVDDDICNPRKLGDKISRHAGVFRAVPVNNTYRHGFIGSVTQGIFHSFSKCADGFLPSPGSAVRHQISVGSHIKERLQVQCGSDVYKRQGQESLIVEITGNQSKVDACINLLSNYEILELARTGIAHRRGLSTPGFPGTSCRQHICSPGHTDLRTVLS